LHFAFHTFSEVTISIRFGRDRTATSFVSGRLSTLFIADQQGQQILEALQHGIHTEPPVASNNPPLHHRIDCHFQARSVTTITKPRSTPFSFTSAEILV
jgi:hypothetical protein